MKKTVLTLCALVLFSFLVVLPIPQAKALSTVSTVTAASSLDKSEQRKSFYANERHWAFFVTLSAIYYSSSSDGLTWSDKVSTGTAATGGELFAVWHDGTYVHYCFSNSSYYLYYRRGLTTSSGTITFDAVQQVWATGATADAGPAIAVDSNGYPWVAWWYKINSTHGRTIISKSSTKDGTWINDSSFPYNMTIHTPITFYYPVITPLTTGRMYFLTYNGGHANVIEGILWDGSVFGSLENATDGAIVSGYQYSATSISDDVYMTFVSTGGSNPVEYRKRTYGSGWGTKETLETDGSYHGSTSCPLITYDDRNIYVAWAYGDKWCYRSMDRDTDEWQVRICLLSDDIQNDQVNTYYKSPGLPLCLFWKRPSPASIKFDSYALDFDGIQISSTNATINSAPEWTESNANFTFTISGDAETVTVTNVYCGEQGRPKEIRPSQADGGWLGSNETQVIQWTLASDQEIQLLWETSAGGLYNVQVMVSVDYQPISGATVSINGVNKTTNLSGSTTWTLTFGDYVIWAYYQGKNQSQAISLNQNRTLGFNFTTTPEIPQPRNFLPIIITALALIFGFILLSARRRK